MARATFATRERAEAWIAADRELVDLKIWTPQSLAPLRPTTSLADSSPSESVEVTACYVAFHRENPLALRILALTDVDVSESELATKAKVQIDAVLSGLIESFAAAVRLVNSDAEPQALVMVSWAAVNGAYSLFQRRIVDETTLEAMLGIARADLLSHVGDDHEA